MRGRARVVRGRADVVRGRADVVRGRADVVKGGNALSCMWMCPVPAVLSSPS